MDLLSVLIIASSLAGAAPAPEASFQSEPYIVLFTQPNYRGTPRNFNEATPVLSRDGSLRSVGSVTIGGGAWELCEGENYTGRCVTLSRSVAAFGGDNLRTVKSVRPVRAPSAGREPNPQSEGGTYVLAFDQTNYRGSPVNFDRAAWGMESNQYVRSITVGKGLWEICDRPNYTGTCITLSESVPDLYVHGFRGRVRSIRPVVTQPR